MQGGHELECDLILLTPLPFDRFVQQEVTLRAPSFSSLGGDYEHAHNGTLSTKLHTFSEESFAPIADLFEGSLGPEAKELIHFVSVRESHRPPWPFTGEIHIR